MGAAHLTELAEEDNLKSFGEALGSKGQASEIGITAVCRLCRHVEDLNALEA